MDAERSLPVEIGAMVQDDGIDDDDDVPTSCKNGMPWLDTDIDALSWRKDTDVVDAAPPLPSRVVGLRGGGGGMISESSSLSELPDVKCGVISCDSSP